MSAIIHRKHKITVAFAWVGCGTDPAYCTYIYGPDGKMWPNVHREFEAIRERAVTKAKKLIDSTLDV